MSAARASLLKTTPKAQSLMKILPEQLLSAETTGKWERALGRIARGEGQITPQAFLDSIRRFSAFIVENAKTSQTGVEFEKQDASPKRTQQHYLTGAKCPQCGGRILESARAFGCEHWREGCKFTIWKDALSRQDANMPAITATAAKKPPERRRRGRRQKAGAHTEWPPLHRGRCAAQAAAARIFPLEGLSSGTYRSLRRLFLENCGFALLITANL